MWSSILIVSVCLWYKNNASLYPYLPTVHPGPLQSNQPVFCVLHRGRHAWYDQQVSWALRNWRPVQSFHGWRWKASVLGRSDRVQEMKQNYLNVFNQVSRSCLCGMKNLLICTLNKFCQQITHTVLPAGILSFWSAHPLPLGTFHYVLQSSII